DGVHPRASPAHLIEGLDGRGMRDQLGQRAGEREEEREQHLHHAQRDTAQPYPPGHGPAGDRVCGPAGTGGESRDGSGGGGRGGGGSGGLGHRDLLGRRSVVASLSGVGPARAPELIARRHAARRRLVPSLHSRPDSPARTARTHMRSSVRYRSTRSPSSPSASSNSSRVIGQDRKVWVQVASGNTYSACTETTPSPTGVAERIRTVKPAGSARSRGTSRWKSSPSRWISTQPPSARCRTQVRSSPRRTAGSPACTRKEPSRTASKRSPRASRSIGLHTVRAPRTRSSIAADSSTAVTRKPRST